MLVNLMKCQLQADMDIARMDSSAHEAIHNFLVQILTTNKGACFAYFGQSIEQPDLAFIFVGWDTLESSKNVFSSDSKRPFAALHDVVRNEQDIAVLLHIPFGPSSEDPSPALGADKRVRVTEVVLYHFPSPLTDKAAVIDSLDQMRPVIGRSEALGVYDGWALEDIDNDKGEKKEIYVNVVGWTDVDAHMRFQASEDFKQNVHHLLNIKSLQQLEMHHVHLHRV